MKLHSLSQFTVNSHTSDTLIHSVNAKKKKRYFCINYNFHYLNVYLLHNECWCSYNVSCTAQVKLGQLCVWWSWQTPADGSFCLVSTALLASRQQRAPASADLKAAHHQQPRAFKRSQMAPLQRITATSSTSWC